MTPEQPEKPEKTVIGARVEHSALRVPFPETFIYSNVSSMSTSMMDIRIGFAEADQDRAIQPRIGVVIPPEHAAQLALNLMTQLVFFEESFGPIRHPVWRIFSEQFRNIQVPGMKPDEMPSTGPDVPPLKPQPPVAAE